jgi:hypothetical protein
LFTVELRYWPPAGRHINDLVVRNVTLSKPHFAIRHLESGLRFDAIIYASNRKGRSVPVNLRVSTLKKPAEGKRLATTASGSGRTTTSLVR